MAIVTIVDMIVTLSGENTFGLQRELRQLTTAFVTEYGDLALEKLDGQEADFEQLQAALTSLPFLAARKMAVLRAPSGNKKFTEQIEQLFDGVPETTDVILVEPKPDKRQAYYKFLKKHTDFREFPQLDQAGLARWLHEAAAEEGAVLSTADARYLIERVGADQQLLANELEKLALYNPKITRDSIDQLTEPAPQSTIFQLLEAAFAGDHRKLLSLYADQRAQKVEPQQIIAMLAWQLHVLAVVKTAGDRPADQIATDARLNPFVVRKSQAITRKITLSELKQRINDLVQIDARSKRVAFNLDDALQHYLLKLG